MYLSLKIGRQWVYIKINVCFANFYKKKIHLLVWVIKCETYVSDITRNCNVQYQLKCFKFEIEAVVWEDNLWSVWEKEANDSWRHSTTLITKTRLPVIVQAVLYIPTTSGWCVYSKKTMMTKKWLYPFCDFLDIFLHLT